jgi:hypothetical protein
MQIDHANIARAVFGADPPNGTVDGALGYVTRLLAALPADERAGYELKPGGENIAPLDDGTMVSVSRVMYPDGQLYKVMTDAPHGEPEWADDGTLDPARYRAFAADAASPPVAPPAPDWITQGDAALLRLGECIERLDALRVQLDANTEKIQQQIDQVVKNAEATGAAVRRIVEPLLPALTGLFAGK